LSMAASGLNGSFVSPKAASMLEYGGTFSGAYLLRRGVFMPWELRTVLDRETIQIGLQRLRPLALVASTLVPEPQSDFAKVAALEASLYMRNQLLRDADWASMAHVLEVRVPLVDHILLGTVAVVACTGQWSERGVGKASLALSPSTPLPERIVSRAKTGFTTPIGSWLQSRSLNPSAALLRTDGRPQHWARQWAERLAAV